MHPTLPRVHVHRVHFVLEAWDDANHVLHLGVALQEQRDPDDGCDLGGQEADAGNEEGPAVAVAEAAFLLHGAAAVTHLVVDGGDVQDHADSEGQTCQEMKKSVERPVCFTVCVRERERQKQIKTKKIKDQRY